MCDTRSEIRCPSFVDPQTLDLQTLDPQTHVQFQIRKPFSDFRLQISDFRFQISDLRFQVTSIPYHQVLLVRSRLLSTLHEALGFRHHAWTFFLWLGENLPDPNENCAIGQGLRWYLMCADWCVLADRCVLAISAQGSTSYIDPQTHVHLTPGRQSSVYKAIYTWSLYLGWSIYRALYT